MNKSFRLATYWFVVAAALLLTAAVYWPGLSGGFLFDDYPNIVDNSGVQPKSADLGSLVRAALSSPASDFKRPLASLSFAMNYLATGLDPYWMKLTNLLIHLLNGVLVFILAKALMVYENQVPNKKRQGLVAGLIAAGWLLLPINVTAVLYVVQRMESMANLFVLAGMIGYLAGRRRMRDSNASIQDPTSPNSDWKGFLLCAGSITVLTGIGCLAKETAAMLPLYAFLMEWVLFGFKRFPIGARNGTAQAEGRDSRIIALFVVVLALPFVLGMLWLLPNVLNSATWVARGFSLSERLLSEARIVVNYIGWTLLPVPNELSFYHDNFRISTGLLSPVTTLASIVALAGLIAIALWLRRQKPLVSLGILFFLGCQLLTATILPLELVYEHRNYFASTGLLLAVIPVLVPQRQVANDSPATFALARWTLLTGLLALWTAETAMTAMAWSTPLRLSIALAERAPDSPRAQYELGRTYIVYSHYDPNSPFTKLAYAPLERSAAIPGSSILPEQALIFMNARMRLPLHQAWWDSMVTKLKARKPTVQDESSLAALTQCDRDQDCILPLDQMERAYIAALSHPDPNARLLAMYGDFAWNVMQDHELGLRMARETVLRAPREPAYRITLIRMLISSDQRTEAKQQIEDLKQMNIGGSLDADLNSLQHSL
jgi:protein O-mannosyl-transferase